MLNYIERKIVEPRKAINCNDNQKGNFKIRMLKEKQSRGQQPSEKKQETLGVDYSDVCDVLHRLFVLNKNPTLFGNKFSNERFLSIVQPNSGSDFLQEGKTVLKRANTSLSR
jgi:hypothetical protein